MPASDWGQLGDAGTAQMSSRPHSPETEEAPRARHAIRGLLCTAVWLAAPKRGWFDPGRAGRGRCPVRSGWTDALRGALLSAALDGMGAPARQTPARCRGRDRPGLCPRGRTPVDPPQPREVRRPRPGRLHRGASAVMRDPGRVGRRTPVATGSRPCGASGPRRLRRREEEREISGGAPTSAGPPEPPRSAAPARDGEPSRPCRHPGSRCFRSHRARPALPGGPSR